MRLRGFASLIDRSGFGWECRILRHACTIGVFLDNRVSLALADAGKRRRNGKRIGNVLLPGEPI
jgi:hypothetical protein